MLQRTLSAKLMREEPEILEMARGLEAGASCQALVGYRWGVRELLGRSSPGLRRRECA